MCKFEFDTHCHTIASGHAFSSLQEMVKSASDKGLKLIGITDHAPKMPGASDIVYFQNLKAVPEKMYGVEVLKGIEANIFNYDGDIDVDDFILDRLDIVIASIHPPCLEIGTKEQNTDATIGAIKNPKVNIIGHPDDSRYLLDYEAIVKSAKKYGTLLELNNSSLNPNGFRKDSDKNIRQMLKFCKKYNVSIIIGSDAHISFDVGNFIYATKIIDELEFPEELIVNISVERLKKYLNLGK
ncbi:MAG: phosphatase [Eubacteriales bacterium]